MPIEQSTLFPPFVPRAPWWGGDLQTLRNFLIQSSPDLSAWPSTRLHLAMADGSGDCLAATLQRPPETPDRALIILVHGLTGCEDSLYIRATARHLLTLGWPVLRLNLRGAGPSRPLCKGHYHAGRSEDLHAALIDLERQCPDLVRSGVVLAGFSLGANMLIKALTELAPDSMVRAAAVVSTPLDLAQTARKMARFRNRIYHDYILRRMREETLSGAAEVTVEERKVVLTARDIWAFDDGFSAPRAGHCSASDYYQAYSAKHYLPKVEYPLLVIHGLNDPWIPPEPYLSFDWSSKPNITPLISPEGGHVGFHGRDHAVAWHNRCIGQFFEHAILRQG